MTPLLSWLLVLVVVGGFVAVFWRVLAWLDDLRFHRRHLRPYDREKDEAA